MFAACSSSWQSPSAAHRSTIRAIQNLIIFNYLGSLTATGGRSFFSGKVIFSLYVIQRARLPQEIFSKIILAFFGEPDTDQASTRVNYVRVLSPELSYDHLPLGNRKTFPHVHRRALRDRRTDLARLSSLLHR